MSPRDRRPLSEPQLRYLRRRVNRHLRRKRRLQGLLRFFAGAAIHLGTALVLGLVGVGGVRHLLDSGALALETIEIEGADRAAPDELKRTLAPWIGANLLGLSLPELSRQLESHPWILQAELRRRLPGTLLVRIEERRPAGLALLGGLVRVVDDRGRVLGIFGPGLAPDFPVLTGVTEGGSEAALARGIALFERLRSASPAFASRISELDLSAPDRVAVRLVEPGPVLLLDPERIERNVELYLARGAEVARELGPLSRVDLRWSGRLVVVPDRGPAPEENG